jgi:hypothetical protein
MEPTNADSLFVICLIRRKILVESQIGQSSTFAFTLPVIIERQVNVESRAILRGLHWWRPVSPCWIENAWQDLMIASVLSGGGWE